MIIIPATSFAFSVLVIAEGDMGHAFSVVLEDFFGHVDNFNHVDSFTLATLNVLTKDFGLIIKVGFVNNIGPVIYFCLTTYFSP